MNIPLWFSNLLFWSAQVAILAAAASLLVRLLRIHQPRALLIHWRTLLFASLLLPFIEPWHRLQAPSAILLAPTASLPEIASASAPASPHWPLFPMAFLARIVAALILLGIAFRLLTLALGLMKLHDLRRASALIPAHADAEPILEKAQSLIGARAEFRISTQADSPVTFGFKPPIVLLPERFLQLSSPSQSAIACHELLHVRRRDWAHHLGEEILRVLFWFHPAILWLVARIRLSREQLVDLEVVHLTAARKTYLEALLEFTSSQRRIAAIPAPPFLAERQLVERISLMLKEVRMSRTRLLASLSIVGCLLAVCAVLAVSVFPLRAAPRQLNSPLAQAAASPASSPAVEANTIWTAKVKRGDMPIQVRGLAKPLSSANEVRTSLSEAMMANVHAGQSALVDTRKAAVRGHVTSVSPQVIAGVRTADITLDSPLPSRTDPSATFEATIVVGKLDNVVYVGRPAMFNPNSQGAVLAQIFKVTDNGKAAQRTNVQFGRASVTTIQVLSGLEPGDTVILSDMSPYDKFPRIQIKR